MAAKLAVGFVSVAFGIIMWMLSTFQTVAQAEENWAQHNQAIACRTVYDLQQQIRAYLKELQFNHSLTDADRAWIDQEIRNLQAEIKRIDPQGNC